MKVYEKVGITGLALLFMDDIIGVPSSIYTDLATGGFLSDFLNTGDLSELFDFHELTPLQSIVFVNFFLSVLVLCTILFFYNKRHTSPSVHA